MVLAPEFVREHPVLYVDDERPNQVVFRAAFGEEFDVLCASSGSEALEILAKRPIAVLLADHKMPGITGVELCERVAREFPDVRRLIVTAYSDQKTAIDAINRAGVLGFLSKPMDTKEVRRTLREVIHGVHVDLMVRQLREAMVDRERLAGLAAARASILHDLANVNAAIAACCDNLEHLIQAVPTPVSQAVREEVDDLRAAVDYFMSLLHGRTRRLGLTGEREAQTLDAADVVAAVVRLVRSHKSRVRFVAEVPPGMCVFADRIDLSRVLVNLVGNAVQAIEEAGVTDGEVRILAQRQAGEVAFLVADNGPGIRPEDRARIFEPTFTTRRASGGNGLGLSICRELAAANGGTIELFEAGQPRGAAFLVTMPADPPAVAVPARRAEGGAP